MKPCAATFRHLVEDASDTVLVLDADGLIVYTNPAGETLFGRPAAKLLGQPFGHVITADNPAEIQITHPQRGTVTADVRSSRITLSKQPYAIIYLRDVTERKRNELALLETSQQLRERIKEQACIRHVADILLNDEDPLEKMLQAVADVLPPGWQYPETAAARITFDDRAYTSKGFRPSAWQQREAIIVSDRNAGTVEICYLDERPESDEGPFLKEERALLKQIALKVGEAIERRRAKAALLRFNRALRLQSAGNSELIHAKEESALLDAICRLCVGLGGYSLAWVGFKQEDEVKRVQPVAQAGFEAGYLESVRISWSEEEGRGLGPVGRAIRAGEPQISQNISTDPSMTPWRDEACRRAYQSAIALPLKDSAGITFGALMIYANELDAFDNEELRLLTELAGDLAFGIVTLRAQAQHRLAEERIEYLAYFDELTDLPNSNRLMETLKRTLDALPAGQQCALLILNVTRFGEIQAVIGVRQANELLRQVASRLRDALREGEMPARIGGDEFAVLLSEGGLENARDCVRRIERLLGDPFRQAGIPISIQMRAGVAQAPDHGLNPEALMLRSAMAMRHAKRNGTVFELYSGPAESESPRYLTLISELHTAIVENQFVLHYQPRVDIGTGRISGVEALVRWRYPEQGLMPPAEFIAIAEQTGLIDPLTHLVLEAAVQQCRAWSDQGFDMPVAVNISVNSFHDPDFLTRIDTLLATWKLNPALLQLEITETTLMKEPAVVRNLINRLKERGIVVAIDDFGTGYSSLSYVASLPIHTLKIDRSFVIRMLESPRTRSVVAATIFLAHSLGIKTVAEGVDVGEQVEALHEMGCTEIQGYYFSRPVEAEQLRRWAETFSLEHYALTLPAERANA
ncbi:EAL domain-containing protein [Halomonas vilamensis]|uniref:EAL domain-containing protein n=1 Tax=Vreelandella vilamensis TaxID=531309 RepID=A0ABU1H9D9_9GAMM|nr:EAL domain-containing protein [Halomonas vilamensis]MDR5900332.1 EAL domain-containing protein [Halomonas vilamensis]